MELHQLRYFMAICRHRSFTRAAEHEHVAQPLLSQHIRKLEDELEARLFDRLGRRIRRTPFGERLQEHARRALDELEGARQEMQERLGIRRGDARPRSRCRIPASPSWRRRRTSSRTQRPLSFNCSTPCLCLRCPCATSCKTFSRSRSFWLIHSSCCLLIRLVCRFSTGTFYFAGIGTSHFAATFPKKHLTSVVSGD